MQQEIISNIKVPENLKIGFSDCAVQQGESSDTYWDQIFKELFIKDKFPYHLEKWRDDYELLINSGAKVYRYTFFPWATCMKADGSLNLERIEIGIQQIQVLIENNIMPILTIWHWDEPILLKKHWHNQKLAQEFNNYVEKLFNYLADQFESRLNKKLHEVLEYVVILNEPNVNAGNSYVMGWWPPEKKNYLQFFKAINNLKNAYNLAYLTLKKIDPEIKLSYTKNSANYYIYEKSKLFSKFLNSAALTFATYYERYYFEKGINPFDKNLVVDFVAVNYWHSWEIDIFKRQTDNKWISELSWHLDPEGLEKSLNGIKLMYPDKEIIITEIGAHFSSDDDSQKIAYLTQCLSRVVNLINGSKFNIKAFCICTLLDNIEWHLGLSNSGLIEVNRETGERKERESYRKISEIIKNKA